MNHCIVMNLMLVYKMFNRLHLQIVSFGKGLVHLTSKQKSKQYKLYTNGDTIIEQNYK